MGNQRWIFLCVFLYGGFIINCKQCAETDGFQATLGHLKSQTPAKDQEAAAKNVIRRLLGYKSDLFDVAVNLTLSSSGRDIFEIKKQVNGNIKISGSSGVAVTWGFHYYLKHYCNAHIAWEGAQLKLNDTLPDVDIIIISNDRFRYYQNVCTPGYSFTWWKWEQWEKHIDWMALNGINLPLAFTAQEAIWKQVYTELNLTDSEIDQHFAGPAFLPWARMGNIRGWAGPLPPEWHRYTVNLQHLILDRMRELGMIPVLPAFAGFVPLAFERHFPHANMTRNDEWNNFENEYCCPYLLSPTDPLFQTVGQKFLRAYINEFGTNHIYSADTFNENSPISTDLEYLRNISRSVYSAMSTVDPMAIWLMQGWLFVHDIIFWTNERVEAFVTSVPIGKMIVLDLQSEQWPQYIRLKSYYGQPFIWCMLHNFGGTLGMFGSAEIINERVFKARNMNGSTMIGTGLTPEGINQNYVIYELMNEMAYRRKPVDLNSWFQNYALRRYGAWNEFTRVTWQTLGLTVYNFKGFERIRGHYVVTSRPDLKINPVIWYSRESFYLSWILFLKAAESFRNNTLYRHDTVDFTRQALQLLADNIYINIMKSYHAKDLDALSANSTLLLEVFDDLDKILATGENFLLGTWLRDAKSFTNDSQEEGFYEYNAKNQITLWGPRGEIVDYANKQWSGVVADYFKPRWPWFTNALINFVMNNIPVHIGDIQSNIFLYVEEPFTLSRKKYPAETQGDSIDEAARILSKWGRHLNLPSP